MIDLIILANLLDGPKHGYALKKQAGTIFAHPELHNNLVYPLLRRFTSQGWVTRKSAPGQRGQTRQQYALTAAGRRALLQRLNTFDDKQAQSSEEFLVRVGMFELLQPATREHILDARQRIVAGREAHFAQLQQIELGSYGAEVVGFLRQRTKEELAWLRRLRRMSQGARPVPAGTGSRQANSHPGEAHESTR